LQYYEVPEILGFKTLTLRFRKKIALAKNKKQHRDNTTFGGL